MCHGGESCCVCVCACLNQLILENICHHLEVLHLEATVFMNNVFPPCVSIGGYGSFQDVITLASKRILGCTFP